MKANTNTVTVSNFPYATEGEFYGAIYDTALQSVSLSMFPAKFRHEILWKGLEKAWKSRHTFKPAKGKIGQWLNKIIKNAGLDYMSSRNDTVYSDVLLDYAKDDFDQEKSLKYEADFISYTKAVRQLKGVDRTIAELYNAGYKGQQIADEVGMTPNNVRVRVARIKEQLADWMAADEYDYDYLAA